MAKQSRTTLKGYFETGDIPTGGNYVDLIDSPVMLNTENTGSLNLQGTGSFSEISVSSTGSFGLISVSSTGSFGLVSASGNIIANQITAHGNMSTQNDFEVLGNTTLGNAISDTTVIHGNITASSNISASGFISAFGSSSLVGLPTTEPSITGALWLSGSGGGSASGSKYLMVFTG